MRRRYRQFCSHLNVNIVETLGKEIPTFCWKIRTNCQECENLLISKTLLKSLNITNNMLEFKGRGWLDMVIEMKVQCFGQNVSGFIWDLRDVFTVHNCSAKHFEFLIYCKFIRRISSSPGNLRKAFMNNETLQKPITNKITYFRW